MRHVAIELRRLSPRDTVTGGDPGSSLEGVNTFTLPDGCLCWVAANKHDYQLDKDSTDPTGIQPLTGPGRWFSVLGQLQADVVQLAAYLTQTAWYVNSMTGNDANDGTTALTPLKTIGELDRRWAGRVFASNVLSVTVNLTGSFPTEALILHVASAALSTGNPPEITVTGKMTTVASGTISAYQAWDSANDLRGKVTDAAQDFTAHVRRRIRITDGAAIEGISWIGSLGGGATAANTGRFRATLVNYTGVFVDPSPGDSYEVETFDTHVREYDIQAQGFRVILKDIEIGPTEGLSIAAIGSCWSRQGQVGLCLVGCNYTAAGVNQVQIFGSHQMNACAISGPGPCVLNGEGGFVNTKGLCVFSELLCYMVMLQRDSTMFDGNGERQIDTWIEQGSKLYDQTFVAYFGCLQFGQGMLARVSNNSMWAAQLCWIWGTGNNATTAVQISNGSGLYYSAAYRPKLVGGTPGDDVMLAGQAAIAWADVPAAATPPNNAVCIEKR